MDNFADGTQAQIDRELRLVNRRCEKKNGCSWATHLETFGDGGTFTGTDAEVLLRNAVGVGMLYLRMREYSDSAIALIYCTDEKDVAKVFGDFRLKHKEKRAI